MVENTTEYLGCELRDDEDESSTGYQDSYYEEETPRNEMEVENSNMDVQSNMKQNESSYSNEIRQNSEIEVSNNTVTNVDVKTFNVNSSNEKSPLLTEVFGIYNLERTTNWDDFVNRYNIVVEGHVHWLDTFFKYNQDFSIR